MAQVGPATSERFSAVRRAVESRVFLLTVLTTLGVTSYALHVWMLGRYAAPPSGDYGIYLADAHALVGPDVTGFGSAYPPVFLLLLLGLLALVDPVTAVRILTPAALLVLPFPFYKIVSRYAAKPWAILATTLFVFNEGYSEMTGWGGGPDLLATAFMLSSLAFFMDYRDSPKRRDVILAGLCTGLVVGTHHLTALVYFGTLLLWMALEAVRLRSAAAAVPFLKLAGWSALFSTPFVPYYLGFGGGIAPQLTPIWPNALENLPVSTAFLFRGSPILWFLVATFSVPAGVRWLRNRQEGSLVLSLVATCFILAILVLQDNPTRSLYYLYIPLLATFPAFFRWLPRLDDADLQPRTRNTVVALVVVFALMSSAVFVGESLDRMSVAIDWYHAINRPELEALDWIRTNTPSDAVVATAGVPFYRAPEGTRFSWWIEGYGERRSFYGGSPIYASVESERTMIREADLFFAGNYGEQGTGLRFAENAPAALANPAIAVDVPTGFETAFFLSDADTTVNYTTGSGVNRAWSPYFSVPTANASWGGASLEVLTVPRGDTHVSFVRNETIEGSSVNVSLDVRPLDGDLRSVSAPVWVGWWMRFLTVQATGNTVTGILRDGAGDSIPFEMTISSQPSTSLRITPTNQDPRWGQSAILVQAMANSSQPQLVLNFRVSFPSVNPSPVTTWDAMSIGAAYGVGYVFQSRLLAEGYYRFAEDPQHFVLVYENEDISIYRVVPS